MSLDTGPGSSRIRRSEVRFTLRPEDAVSALSIGPYFSFPRVVPVRQEVTTTEAGDCHSVISFESDRRRPAVCTGCGKRTRAIHSITLRRVTDLPLAHARVELVIPHRKVRCRHCGVRAEHHEFLPPSRRLTQRRERAVADLCRVLPVKQVAAHVVLDWHTVKAIDKRRLEREVGDAVL